MILEELKQISKELKDSAKSYDNSFKNTAIIATEGLINQQEKNKVLNSCRQTSLLPDKVSHNQSFDKNYFVNKYGSLKKAKEEYKKLYGEKNYGRSWKDFLSIVNQISSREQPVLTLEQRIKRIEDILIRMGYEL